MGAGLEREVAVVGGGVSGCAAALACVRNGVKVTLVRPPRALTDPGAGPDPLLESLAPLGGQLLSHLLRASTIAALTRGRFEGIVREGQFQPFDGLYGPGRHIEVRALAEALEAAACRRGARVHEAKVTELRRVDGGGPVALWTSAGEVLRASAVLDASGPFGPGARALGSAPRWLSGAILVVQASGDVRVERSDSAHFEQRPGAWRWLAYDHRGRCTTTSWSRHNTSNMRAPSIRARDCRWYRQRRAAGDGVFLLGRAAYGVDPITGIGMTLALSGALQLARSLGERPKRLWTDPDVGRAHETRLDEGFWGAHRHVVR